MPHRDPATGQFVAGTKFDDIEVVSFAATAGVDAANLTGATTFTGGDVDVFEGLELIDYDDIVDRNESLRLLQVQHELSVYANSTETADGNVVAAAEVATAPSLTDVGNRVQPAGTENAIGPDDVAGNADFDDTIDLIGRVLTAVGHAPFSDGATGVGGGGSEGHDQYTSSAFPAEMGTFHPRDELFLNGKFVAWNIDDAGIHLTVSGQHVYEVISD